jgi:hypothetical protein
VSRLQRPASLSLSLALPMIRNSRSLRNACSLLCFVLIVLFLESKLESHTFGFQKFNTRQLFRPFGHSSVVSQCVCTGVCVLVCVYWCVCTRFLKLLYHWKKFRIIVPLACTCIPPAHVIVTPQQHEFKLSQRALLPSLALCLALLLREPPSERRLGPDRTAPVTSRRSRSAHPLLTASRRAAWRQHLIGVGDAHHVVHAYLRHVPPKVRRRGPRHVVAGEIPLAAAVNGRHVPHLPSASAMRRSCMRLRSGIRSCRRLFSFSSSALSSSASSGSASVPHQFRISSASIPHQFRISSTSVPHQFRIMHVPPRPPSAAPRFAARRVT